VRIKNKDKKISETYVVNVRCDQNLKNTKENFCLFLVLLLYMIPALLYCLYNNLAFVNLARFDPTTYYVLLQLRVVLTGIIFQVSMILFSIRIKGRCWN